MLRLIPILLAVFFTVNANAETGVLNTPAGGGGISRGVKDVLRGFVAPTIHLPQEHLVAAVKAIEARGSKLTDKRRQRIANAARTASQTTGVDATLLIAVARMETDFRPLQKTTWQCRDPRFEKCGADCGITQHWIFGGKRWVIRYCKRLANNYTLSFTKSAQEIAHHITWCKKNAGRHAPLKRCVLNRYNSGTFYLTPRRCNRRYRYCLKGCPRAKRTKDLHLTKPEQQHRLEQYLRCRARCRHTKHKCRARAAYWQKVMCFDYGARNRKRATANCRRSYLFSTPAKFYKAVNTK